jgi:Sigma-70, region 4
VALTDEQRAMLQLLLEGGQGYEEIGSLLGISAEEVRSRARGALGEIGGADPDAQVPISDYLLGQADPIGRADAVRHLQSDAEANALAERLVAQLRLLAPKAQLPEIPSARGGRRAPTPPPAPPEAPPAPTTTTGQPPPAAPPPGGPSIRERMGGALGRLSRSQRQSRIAVGLGAGVILIIGVVLAVSGAFGGGDDGDGGGGEDCAEIDAAQAQQAGIPTISLQAIGPPASADCPPTGQITLAPLQPQQGQNQNQTPQFALQMNAAELEPTGNGEAYVLWLYRSDTEALPLGQQAVDESGNLTGGVPLAGQQLLLLQAFQTLRLSRVDAAQQQQIQQSLGNQGRQPVGVVPFTGEPALEGDIAQLGLDQLLQQAQGQGGGGGGQPQGGGGQGGNAPQG